VLNKKEIIQNKHIREMYIYKYDVKMCGSELCAERGTIYINRQECTARYFVFT